MWQSQEIRRMAKSTMVVEALALVDAAGFTLDFCDF